MQKKQNVIISLVLLAGILLVPMANPSQAVADITVAAANSTCPALKKAAEIFSGQHGVAITYICKSSGVLAKGLESGHISADYYISASKKWLDYLVVAGRIDPASVQALWANRIIAATATTSGLKLQGWHELATAKITTIFVGDPSTTPLGRQFKNAMVKQGLWQAIRPKIVAKRHLSLTREALHEADDTTIGIMFPTSLDNSLKSVLVMPEEWHEPIAYYGGPLVASKNKEDIAKFQLFLKSEKVNNLFRQAGYLIRP